MAAFGIGILLAPILGPTLGGWITDNYSWRWIFYLNLPVGILSLILMNRFVFDPHYVKRGDGKVDLWGIGFLALGIGSLQVFLDTGQRKDWFSSTWEPSGLAQGTETKTFASPVDFLSPRRP